MSNVKRFTTRVRYQRPRHHVLGCPRQPPALGLDNPGGHRRVRPDVLPHGVQLPARRRGGRQRAQHARPARAQPPEPERAGGHRRARSSASTGASTSPTTPRTRTPRRRSPGAARGWASRGHTRGSGSTPTTTRTSSRRRCGHDGAVRQAPRWQVGRQGRRRRDVRARRPGGDHQARRLDQDRDPGSVPGRQRLRRPRLRDRGRREGAGEGRRADADHRDRRVRVRRRSRTSSSAPRTASASTRRRSWRSTPTGSTRPTTSCRSSSSTSAARWRFSARSTASNAEQAKALSIRYGRCIVCGRKLKAAKSVEAGIGPVCMGRVAARAAA